MHSQPLIAELSSEVSPAAPRKIKGQSTRFPRFGYVRERQKNQRRKLLLVSRLPHATHKQSLSGLSARRHTQVRGRGQEGSCVLACSAKDVL